MSTDTGKEHNPKSKGRSRLTNGNVLLPGADGRSKFARRLRDLVENYVADVVRVHGYSGPDDLTETQRTMVRRVATISVEMERWEVEFANADNVSEDGFGKYQTASKTQRALMESLGLLQPAQRATGGNGGDTYRDAPDVRQIGRAILAVMSNAKITTTESGAIVSDVPGTFSGMTDTGGGFTLPDQEGAGHVTKPSPSQPSPPAEPEQKIEMVGTEGHWIEWKETDREGREKWAVCNPAGVPIGNVWGKDKARDAAEMFIEFGGITA